MKEAVSAAEEIRTRFVEELGHVTQNLGAGRVIGQVFAFVYFSPEPRSLSDLTEALGISKGSASMTVRQLEQWGALKRVWIKGDRKDYYQASTEFGDIIRKILFESASRTMKISDMLVDQSLETVEQEIAAGRTSTDLAFTRDRLVKIRNFRNRIKKIWSNAIVKFLLQRNPSRHF